MSQIGDIDHNNSSAINVFEKNLEVMKNDLKGYYELVISQENCINSMKEQNDR